MTDPKLTPHENQLLDKVIDTDIDFKMHGEDEPYEIQELIERLGL